MIKEHSSRHSSSSRSGSGVSSTTPGSSSQQEGGGLDIKELLMYFLSKWYWIVLSVALCLAYASYKLMKATPTYASNITVLFKSEGSGSGTNAIPDLSQLGLPSNNANLANEIITIRSISVLSEVVEELNINNSYYVKESLHNRLLYKDSPVKVQSVAAPDKERKDPYSFTITIKSPTEVELSKFAGEDPAKVLRVPVGKAVRTPFGPLKITLTEKYSPEWNGTEVLFTHTTPEAVAASLAGCISYELVEYSESIIRLTIVDFNPARAQDILRSLLGAYNRRWVIERNQAANTASQFIADRINVIAGELGSVDEDISSYRSANLIGSGGSTGDDAGARLAASQQAKMNLENRISLVKYMRREVQNASLETPLPNPAGISGTTLEGQIGQFNTLVMERNRMLAASSENNPLVQERTEMLHTLINVMVASVDNLLLSLSSEMNLIQAQEAKSTSDLVRSPSQAKYLLGVERQQKVKESLYLFLLQKREENELQQAFTAYNTRVINDATYNPGPVSPNRQSALLMALGVGLAVPLVVMFLLKNFDNKVHSRRDIRSMRAPFLGEIPLQNGSRSLLRNIKGAKPEEVRPIVVRRDNRDTINEAFRVVRANFEFISSLNSTSDNSKGDIRTIMVTSLYASSGKTFISLNLASALAVRGNKVVVVDLDMRKASLSRSVGAHLEGISNYVIGRAPLHDIIVHDHDGIEGLDIIPAGPIPPNPSEMLYSNRLEDMIEMLKKDYEYIIIDCPPVEIVADTKIIARFADMTIFVIRAGLFEKNDVNKIHEFYDDARFRNLAVLLNGVDTSVAYYGLQKYARYSSYTSDDHSPKK